MESGHYRAGWKPSGRSPARFYILQMKRIAVLMTCYNRREKTLRCLSTLQEGWEKAGNGLLPSIFLTDDGYTDGTADAIREHGFTFPIHILPGTGNLFWNGGMINSWKAAIAEGNFDGYLWLNDDTYSLPEFWEDLKAADTHCMETYGKHGIYVGSTKDQETGAFTYGGFNYISKVTLLDQLLPPDGTFQSCQAAHGNITYVSKEVVDKMGIFCEKYWHGGTDHDYTYLAYKAGVPVLVLPRYSAVCENDHLGKTRQHTILPLKERIRQFWAPNGYNMHNTLLFSRRCFPWRTPFVFLSGVIKLLFPKLGYGGYLKLRKHGI